ncbi:MAG TPA: 2-amino-4-hydroxy-6-hydroxymethyldihydropteridine diphosphokinase [Acidimicrobiia bacterium]|jgi:2-amino-4-hydroxy-6-hydroxymethyldihydropteridine diphosphokinase|nr:2-amino-4-hydroxy-6-hydroxymethyldihydropteridine diphosphokinase [Acidimicrobiia bacterium]
MSTRRAYLGLGSNVGDRAAHLQSAVDGLAARAGRVVAISPVYETEPVGGPAQPDYLNAVVAVETALSPRELLVVGKALEAEAGREPPDPGRRWGPRPLDVDVLMVGDEHVNEPDLVVPHPRIHQRAFVLAPLADVAPELVLAPSAGWQGVRRCALQLRLEHAPPPPE